MPCNILLFGEDDITPYCLDSVIIVQQVLCERNRDQLRPRKVMSFFSVVKDAVNS